jgi:hypothetical protein
MSRTHDSGARCVVPQPLGAAVGRDGYGSAVSGNGASPAQTKATDLAGFGPDGRRWKRHRHDSWIRTIQMLVRQMVGPGGATGGDSALVVRRRPGQDTRSCCPTPRRALHRRPANTTLTAAARGLARKVACGTVIRGRDCAGRR